MALYNNNIFSPEGFQNLCNKEKHIWHIEREQYWQYRAL